MITSVTRRANIEGFSAPANAFITFPEIREYINEGTAELYDLLVAARGQEWYRKSYTFSTVGNEGAYPLPSDLYQVISVDINLAPNIVLTAHPYMESERNRFRWYPGWFYTMPVYFRLLGVPQSQGANLQPPEINFIPAPTSISQVTINYYPVFTPFQTDGSEDNNVFDGVNGWEGYIIWYATAICLEKLEQNSDFAMTQLAKFKERIEAMAPDRHAGDAERVHDVGADYDPFSVV